MGNRAAVDKFYQTFDMEKPAFSPGEKADLTAILTHVVSYLGRIGQGPYTLLILPEEKLDALGLDPDGRLEQDAVDALVGWMLDLVLFGNDLSKDVDQALANAGGKLILSTVAGSSLRATREDGQIVLTDPWGARATVSKAVFGGPVITAQGVDDLLMWGGWKDSFPAHRRFNRAAALLRANLRRFE